MRTMDWRQAAVTLLAVAFLAAAAACGPTPADPSAGVPSPLPPSPTASALPVTAPPAVTPTPQCLLTAGTLTSGEVASDAMPAPLRFLVYLPPCYTERPDLRYPVVYLFHGQFYDETQWVRLGTPEVASQLISSGQVPPFLIVMPFDPYPYQPHEYGFDEAFIKDLIPHIDASYRTRTERSQRLLGGLSRGSSWSLHFALSRPQIFGGFAMHSPVIFASDGLLVEKWLDIIPAGEMPAVYLDVAENDPYIQNAYWLEDVLTARGIPHEWHLNTGFHEEEYWAVHVEEYLRWYAAVWQDPP